LIVWDLVSGKRFDNDASHAAPFTGVLAREGRIYTAGADGQVIVWDRSGKRLETFPAPSSNSRFGGFRGGFGRGGFRGSSSGTAVFAPDGSSVATSEGSSALKGWW
jgi:hypothetical protein